MPRPNTKFELSVQDIDLIEDALRTSKASLSHKMAETSSAEGAEHDVVRDIHDLLGRLHNQKEFYRPNRGVYVSG